MDFFQPQKKGLNTSWTNPQKRRSETLFAAYCESDIPAQPLYAYNTTSLSRDDVGQVVTYHCWTGFGFSGPPVPVTTPAPTTVTGRRRRRSVDSLTQREVECVPWDGGTRGYWSYQYQIPSRCYSKHRAHNLTFSVKLFKS